MVEMVELATPERTQGARASEDARDADETSLILVLAFVPMGPRGFNRFPACDLAILNERQITESLIEAFSPCLIALYNGISTLRNGLRHRRAYRFLRCMPQNPHDR
jgi:hypothetical protein